MKKKKWVEFTLFYVVIALIVAQLLKFTPIENYFSGHALILTSLVLIVGLLKGIKNPSFSIAFVFSILYLYDRVYIHEFIEFGHTIQEIFIGVLFGIILTLILYSLFGGFKRK
ncbi:MAG: hypothetical protein ABIH25_02970 [Candidatus Woesearchaeota archaeon]